MMKNLKSFTFFTSLEQRNNYLSSTLDWNSNLTPFDFAVLGDLKLFRIA